MTQQNDVLMNLLQQKLENTHMQLFWQINAATLQMNAATLKRTLSNKSDKAIQYLYLSTI